MSDSELRRKGIAMRTELFGEEFEQKLNQGTYDEPMMEKFRDVAMRGPWTSGGIETNFGVIGHAPTCSTPVDYLVRENEDGGTRHGRQ